MQPIAETPTASPGDSLAALKEKLARAKGIKVEIPDADKERAQLLADLAAEAARIEEEKQTLFEFRMNEARFAVRERLGESFAIESTVIEKVGPFVVRAVNKEQRKRLNDNAGKSGFDAASATVAMQVTEFPPKEELKGIFEAFPYVVDTIVQMAMKAGGAQLDADRRKSG